MAAERTNVLFHEVQRFGLWLRVLVAASMAAAVVIDSFALRAAVVEPVPAGVLNIILLVACGIALPIALAGLLWAAKLEAEVRCDAVYVRLFPFHLRYRKVAAGELSEYYARTYRPIIEYGGWGIRYGFGGRGRAYNMSGNQGVQLIMKSGKKLLIGSQRPDELASSIDSIVRSPQSEGAWQQQQATFTGQ